MKIDAHQHFWYYSPLSHGWIDDSMDAIRRDFLPDDLYPVLQNSDIDFCIAVQAEQSENETKFLISLSQKYHWIKAVIGWVDLNADNIDAQLNYYKQYQVVKGFRHILQAEEPDFMLAESFLKGIASLQKHQYCYELLIYPKHLKAALELVKQFPKMRFMIDHIAKPLIKTYQINEWRKGISDLANCPNVYCKLSGMVSEADWKYWKRSDFEPYIDTVKTVFGVDRIVFGSDWPVCLLAASYDEVIDIVQNYFKDYSDSDRDKIFGLNAIEFYQIKE